MELYSDKVLHFLGCGMCVCVCPSVRVYYLATRAVMSSSFEPAVFGFVSISGGWMLLCKEPIMAEGSPHRSKQRITSTHQCSLGVLAGVGALCQKCLQYKSVVVD